MKKENDLVVEELSSEDKKELDKNEKLEEQFERIYKRDKKFFDAIGRL